MSALVGSRPAGVRLLKGEARALDDHWLEESRPSPVAVGVVPYVGSGRGASARRLTGSAAAVSRLARSRFRPGRLRSHGNAHASWRVPDLSVGLLVHGDDRVRGRSSTDARVWPDAIRSKPNASALLPTLWLRSVSTRVYGP